MGLTDDNRIASGTTQVLDYPKIEGVTSAASTYTNRLRPYLGSENKRVLYVGPGDSRISRQMVSLNQRSIHPRFNVCDPYLLTREYLEKGGYNMVVVAAYSLNGTFKDVWDLLQNFNCKVIWIGSNVRLEDFLHANRAREPMMVYGEEPALDMLSEYLGSSTKLDGQSEEKVGKYGMVGCSPAMQKVYKTIDALAELPNTDVCIEGEAGTGKGLFARALHNATESRRGNRFVTLNCARYTGNPDNLENALFGHKRGSYTGAYETGKGVIAEAEGGTLLLDEIESMPSGMQAKLLNFLEDRTYTLFGDTREIRSNVRIIFATNQPLEVLVEKGMMRMDFYTRISEPRIRLPALRDRQEDIVPLAHHLLKRYCMENGCNYSLSPEALGWLQAQSWDKGNVRDLYRAMAKAVVQHKVNGTIGSELLLEDFQSASGEVSHQTGWMTLEQLEKNYMDRTLTAFNGVRAVVSKILGIDVSTLRRKMKVHGLWGKYSLSPS